jgi:hypothetical protein
MGLLLEAFLWPKYPKSVFDFFGGIGTKVGNSIGDALSPLV